MITVRTGLMVLLMFLCTGYSSLATITFGSKDAGFIVKRGTLDLSNASLVNGSLFNTGGTLASSSGSLDCTNLKIETTSGATVATTTVDGSLNFSSGISLGDNERLIVSGGVLPHTVTVNGSTTDPSIIQGFGSFASSIIITDECQLIMRWQDELNVSISCGDDCVVALEQDVHFAINKKIVASSDEYTTTIQFNGYRLFMGGDEAVTTTLTNPQIWSSPQIVLTGPLSIQHEVTILDADAGCSFAGRGNTLTFGEDAVLDNNLCTTLFSNITLSGVIATTLAGSGIYAFIDTTLEDEDFSLTLDGSITSATVDIFGGSATFGASAIALNKNFTFDAAWTTMSDFMLNGHGHILQFDTGSMVHHATARYADITLANVQAESFDTSNAQVLYLSRVDWLSADNGAIRVTDAQGQTSGACLTLTEHANGGNIFALPVSWDGATIELLSDVTLTTTWSFTQDTVIKCAGHVFDVEDGTLHVAPGVTLVICDGMLTNVTQDSLQASGGAAGVVSLSNVTMKLAESVDWSSLSTYFIINGPATIITGDYMFEVSRTSSVIDGVTVFYDTLSETSNSNVSGFNFANGGRLMFVGKPTVEDVVIDGWWGAGWWYDHPVYLQSTRYLAGENVISFGGNTLYDGSGYALVFPPVPDLAVFNVDNGSTVVTRNILLAGLQPGNLSINGSLYFSDQTTIRLYQDWTLDRVMYFGSYVSYAATTTLDLNGHTIDLADSGAAIILDTWYSADVLRICNGRIKNLSGTKLRGGLGTTIILEDVELVLVDDFTYEYAALRIEGNCSVRGLSGKSFIYTSTDVLTVASGSCLRFMDGITYYHNNDQATNFVFADSTAQLELIGGMFKTAASTQLQLYGGRLIIDHTSVINVGAGGLLLNNGAGTDLRIDIRPGAIMTVAGSGMLSY